MNVSEMNWKEEREELILGRWVYFRVPKGVRIEIWISWNNPEKSEGRMLSLIRSFKPSAVAIVGFFRKGGELWAFNLNPLDCQILVNNIPNDSSSFPVPDGAQVQINKDNYPQYEIRFKTTTQPRPHKAGNGNLRNSQYLLVSLA